MSEQSVKVLKCEDGPTTGRAIYLTLMVFRKLSHCITVSAVRALC